MRSQKDTSPLSSIPLSAREKLPLNPKKKSPYRIVNNKIETQDCEINIVEHCNMACRSCSHLSPISNREFIDPLSFKKDLYDLKNIYKPKVLKLIGGEPLLHPHLLDLIRIARESEFAEEIHIVTNGLLLKKMGTEFWESIDKVLVSIYTNNLDFYRKMIPANRNFQSKLKFSRFKKFRESYSESGTSNTTLVQRIYDTCKKAHVWRCHTIANGYMYRCAQSYFFSKTIDPRIVPDQSKDRLRITDATVNDLVEFLEQPERLSACSNCLGNVGLLFDHEQLPGKEWRVPQIKPTEELIDLDHLKRLERYPDAPGSFSELLIRKLTSLYLWFPGLW